MNYLSPSILSWISGSWEKISKLWKEPECLAACGCDGWTFVPSISYGMPVLKAVRPHRHVPGCTSDREAGRYVEEFAACGADLVNFHLKPQRM